jgi:uncharacterized protein (TIGR00730 family)
MSEQHTPTPKPRMRVDREILEVGEDTALTSWRIFRIIAEFVSAFELMRKYGLAATIYGSARDSSCGVMCEEASKLAGLLAQDGFAIVTGGGSGIMAAANKGAREVGGQSIGLNIRLPHEQNLNSHTTDSETFHFFFTRKVALAFASEVYIFFPGGFGTLDEFFEMTTLVQTKKIDPIPIVLVGRDFWLPLLDWIRFSLHARYGTINEEDMEIYYLVDNAEEAHEYIKSRVLHR